MFVEPKEVLETKELAFVRALGEVFEKYDDVSQNFQVAYKFIQELGKLTAGEGITARVRLDGAKTEFRVELRRLGKDDATPFPEPLFCVWCKNPYPHCNMG